MMAASGDLRYGFVNGRIRALENTLLDRRRYERIIRAEGAAEFRSLLADTIYGHYLAEGGGSGVERAFLLAIGDYHNFLGQYCHDPWIMRMLSLRIDLHNLKTAAKDTLAGRETDPERLLSNGDWAVSQLEALATVRDDAAPAGVRNAIAEAVRTTGAERTADPVLLDATLDRVQQAEQLTLAGGSSFVLGYLCVHADVENLRTFVRVKALGEEKASFELAFLPGGTLTREQLAEIWDEELDAVPGRLRMTPYARLAEEGVAGVRQGTMLKLERLCRERELVYLRGSRYMTFGYEPLFAYYLFRENEITNLRQLHAAKEAGLEESLCRETVAHVD